MRIAVVARQRRLPPGMEGGYLVDGLRSIGHDAELVPDGGDASWADAALLLGGANWYPGTWELPRERRPRIVLWHTEPLPLPSAAGLELARRHPRELAKIVLRDSRRSDPRSNVHGLRRVLRDRLVDVLVVSTFERKLFLAEHGLDVPFVPLGYDPVTHGEDRKRTRDLDVLFLGALDVPRRRRILRGLRHDGVAVRALGDWSDARLWGEDRVELLNRTKILLNLPRHPGMLSGGRMLLGMANKALIVAEPIFEPTPYVPGEHFVGAPLDEMAEAIRRHLRDEPARRAITESAYSFVTTDLTLTRSLGQLVELAAA
jgi:Glycosyl transferases group 1